MTDPTPTAGAMRAAEIILFTGKDYPYGRPREQAYAAIIDRETALPDLLAERDALRAALELFWEARLGILGNDSTAPTLDDVANAARAALSKAKGGAA